MAKIAQWMGPRFTCPLTMSTAKTAVQDAVGNDKNIKSSVWNTLEQFFSGIQIEKAHGKDAPTPGFRNCKVGEETGNFGNGDAVGPTIQELDPYFPRIFGDPKIFIRRADYIGFNHDHDGKETTDFCEDKCNPTADGVPTSRASIDTVRISALRGPLIMSGWGFGVDDFPVPPKTPEMPDKAKFLPDLRDKRTTWKTGPVHLMWDDERQVWTGGYRIVCGVLIEGAISPATSVCEPSTFKIRILRNTKHLKTVRNAVGAPAPAEQETCRLSDVFNETITVQNRDISLEQEFQENAVFVIAIKLNYEWLPLWVGCPDYGHCDCLDPDAPGDAARGIPKGKEPPPPPCLKWYGCPGCAPASFGDAETELPKKKLDEIDELNIMEIPEAARPPNQAGQLTGPQPPPQPGNVGAGILP